MRIILLALMVLPGTAKAEVVTATRMVRPAAIIAPGDVTVSDMKMPGAIRSIESIVGLEARVMLYPGRPIRPGDVGPAALVERNEPVRLVYRKGVLTILSEGRALSRGAIGDSVRVMNLGSRVTVVGRVADDGSVLVSEK